MEIFQKPKINLRVSNETRNAIIEIDLALDRINDGFPHHLTSEDGVDWTLQGNKDRLKEDSEKVSKELFEIVRNTKLNTDVRINALYYLTGLMFVLDADTRAVLRPLFTNLQTIQELYTKLKSQLNANKKIRMKNILKEIEANIFVFRNI